MPVYSSESVSLEPPDAFFPLLDAFLAPPSSSSESPFDVASSPKQSYDAAFALLSSSNTLTKAAIESLKLSLALKEASPRIETHYQLWNASEVNIVEELDFSDVDYYGLRFTTVEKLEKELARESSQRRAKSVRTEDTKASLLIRISVTGLVYTPSTMYILLK
jgi:hypothetical protein